MAMRQRKGGIDMRCLKLSFLLMILIIFSQYTIIAKGLGDLSGLQLWIDDAGVLVPAVQDHFILGADNWQNAKTFHMVVIGDSIAWGCGLNRDEKYSYLVANWLQGDLKGPVDVTVLAHT